MTNPSAGKDHQLPRFGRRTVWLLLLLVTGGNLTVAFYPFRLDPPRHTENGVHRDVDGSLRFSGDRNRAATRAAPGWLPAVAAGAPMRLELVVRTTMGAQSGPARIFTVSADYQHANLTVAQEGSDLLVRVRRHGSTEGGTPAYVVPAVFADGGWREIGINFAADRLSIDLDGQQRLLQHLSRGGVRTWDPSYRLALGDELIGGRRWTGHIRHATVIVDESRVDYVKPSHLDIPRRTVYVPDRFDELLRLESASDVAVAVLQMVAFVPIGFLLVPLLARRSGTLAWLSACFLLSVLLEQGKVFIAGRHPSAIAIATHLVGCLLGRVLRAVSVRR